MGRIAFSGHNEGIVKQHLVHAGFAVATKEDALAVRSEGVSDPPLGAPFRAFQFFEVFIL